MRAIAVVVAAILERIGKLADFVSGHQAFVLPAARKEDPDFNGCRDY
jgi:hypothetical protein